MSDIELTEVTSADVRLAFRYYLGREPESGSVIDIHRKHSSTPFALREAVFRSGEAISRNGISTIAGMFSRYVPGSSKVFVIGNCQGPNIARAIATCTNCSVFGIEAMFFSSNPNIFLQELEDADHIVSCWLSSDFGEIATEKLRARFAGKLCVFSSLYFDGLLPDMTYWGGRADRSRSPVGDYHSRIVLRSFLAGKSQSDCLASFNTEEYRTLGYFDATNRSLQEIGRREVNCDLRFLDFIQAELRSQPMFMTFNHPTAELFIQIAAAACEFHEIEYAPVDGRMLFSSLSQDTIWPIYPELADYFNLSYPTGRLSFSKSGTILSLDEFVWRSYDIYARYGKERLLASATEQQREGVLS